MAIVGPTGAGKTTLMKLLLRFYDVDGGALRVDGHDVRNVGREDLRQSFSMVLQDAWLFKGSICENIRFGRLDATDEEVEAAARYAHCEHFIKTLPGGYDFELDEGATNISQGQRQLLTIARAVLADRPILILDEATSNVDTRTEWRIQRAMDKLMAGRTSFVIAHRLDHQERRRHPGAARRRRCGEGHARGASRRGRLLRAAVPVAVRGGRIGGGERDWVPLPAGEVGLVGVR